MTDVMVFQMPLFKRAYKNLHHNQQQAVDNAILKIIENPRLGEVKKGDLNDVYVYKFACINQQYLLAYEWNTETRTLLALGVHKNFYRNLKRYH